MNKTVMIVLALAAVGVGVFLFTTRKKGAATVTPYTPPRSVAPQANLVSQIGSFLGSAQGQQIAGSVYDDVSNLFS